MYLIRQVVSTPSWPTVIAPAPVGTTIDSEGKEKATFAVADRSLPIVTAPALGATVRAARAAEAIAMPTVRRRLVQTPKPLPGGNTG